MLVLAIGEATLMMRDLLNAASTYAQKQKAPSWRLPARRFSKNVTAR
jgi:hypothetical protein